MTDAVMIFAAGFGTRMGQLTQETPKPLLHVSGKPLIDHALQYAQDAGVTRIVVNTHYLAEQLHDHLQHKSVVISHEVPEILDTGGGMKAALPLLKADAVFTLNPDVLWIGPNPLDLLRNTWDPDKMDGLLLCTPMDRTYGRKGDGDFSIDPSGGISRGGHLVYGGAQILKTAHVADVDETVFSLNSVWDQMNRNGRLHLLSYPGEWCDIGHPKGLELAEDLLANRDG